VVLIPGVDLMGIMLTAQFVNGILLPVLLVFLVRIINDRRVMGTYRNGKLANMLSYLTIFVVVVLSVVLLVMQVMGIG
jgi:Mn2+/Fe2+ NRAMP family transporter